MNSDFLLLFVIVLVVRNEIDTLMCECFLMQTLHTLKAFEPRTTAYRGESVATLQGDVRL